MALAGKVCVVTGASGGIGEAIATALAAAGAKVGIGARREDELTRVRDTIQAANGEAVSCVTDVTKREQVKELVRVTEEAFGPINVLVNNAGVMYYTKMSNIHEDEWERTVDVNCKGTLNGIGAVLGGMVERGGGHIVNISSDAGRRVFPTLAVYSGTKYFVEAMSEGMRRELVGTGVRVTTIQPGDVATDLLKLTTDEQAASEIGVEIGGKIGVGSTRNQVLDPSDIASAVMYAVTAPSHVAINEVLVEPRDQT
ncbi:unnamed protein product [Chrysoparadoxa australica]